MRPTNHKTSMLDLSAKWGTTQMTISNMAKKGCDFDQPDEDVAKWMLKHSMRKSKAMKEAIALVLKPEAIEQVKQEERRSLEEMRDYYSDQLDKATNSGHTDHEEIKFWNDLWLKADESIRRSQAHERKLGLEQGETLPKATVEEILKNVIWAGNACCNNFSKQLAQSLSGKTPAEIHKILKPTLLALLIFEGFDKLAKVPGEINLPQWVIDCVQTEEKLYLKP